MIVDTQPAVGQIWDDYDIRDRGRTGARRVQIESITEATESEYRTAECTVVGTRRKVRIRCNRFKPNSTGYRLVQEGRI